MATRDAVLANLLACMDGVATLTPDQALALLEANGDIEFDEPGLTKADGTPWAQMFLDTADGKLCIVNTGAVLHALAQEGYKPVRDT